MFYWNGVNLLAVYDEQQCKHDLTFLHSAFPSKFFACKRTKCFHKFVMQVLPLQLLQFTILYYATPNCVTCLYCKLECVEMCCVVCWCRYNHAFLHISPSLHNYDMKWPNFKFTWERERQGDKFYHLYPNLSAFPSLQHQPKSPYCKLQGKLR